MEEERIKWLNEINCHLFDKLIENTSNLVTVNYYINGELHSHIAVLENVIPFIGIKTSFYYIPFIGEKVALESVALYDTKEIIFKNQNLKDYAKDSDEEMYEEQTLLYGKNIIEKVDILLTPSNRRLKAFNLNSDFTEFSIKDGKKIKVLNPILEDLYINGMEHYETIDENGMPTIVLLSGSRTKK